ncbi:dnaJ homolog subfamily C member 28 [Pseudophryne corroboree]|uniref:dnaJ homolog subfamily C member 28 n=1 Tax=Pseudophryne corroboree TaxID=495146 RepID=UPI0030814065
MKPTRILLAQNLSFPLKFPLSLSKSLWLQFPDFCPYSSFKHNRNIKDCYRLMNVSEDCSVDEIRDSYRTLAKKYHPDSGSTTADANMFVQIDEAYRELLTHLERESKKRQPLDDDEDEKTSNYKMPQHRHYLSYEGVGYGTPSQRQRQYIQFRVDRASDQVLDFQKQKLERQYAENSMLARNVRQSKKVKITQAIERLVEDLIQESMAKGDFDNLRGKGKPLDKFSYCPHIDPMTHNLNRILIDNGYLPEWIVLQKEIRETIDKLRNELVASRKKLGDPMTYAKENQWTELCEHFKDDITKLNKKINDFNLVVPLLNRQMVHFNADKELLRAEQAYFSLRDEMRSVEKAEDDKHRDNKQVNLRELLVSWIVQLKKLRDFIKQDKQ